MGIIGKRLWCGDPQLVQMAGDKFLRQNCNLKDHIKKYCGSPNQLFGIKSYTFDEGKEKGTKAFEINTGSGLRFTILPDRGMDISYAEMNYRNISFISKNGIVSPVFFNSRGNGWLRSFGGGLLATCGLTQIGRNEEADDIELGLHGRIGNTPAYDVSHSADWINGKYEISVSGKMRQSSFYDENLVLKRTIKACAAENRFIVKDEIENEGTKDCLMLLLYHCNFGYPLLDHSTKLIADIISTKAFDSKSAQNIDKALLYSEPQVNGSSLLYFHDIRANDDGYAIVKLYNENEKFGIYIKYNKKTLPYLSQWKNSCEQDYVTALEPGTGLPIGRSENIKNGHYTKIAPGQSISIELEFGGLVL